MIDNRLSYELREQDKIIILIIKHNYLGVFIFAVFFLKECIHFTRTIFVSEEHCLVIVAFSDIFWCNSFMTVNNVYIIQSFLFIVMKGANNCTKQT